MSAYEPGPAHTFLGLPEVDSTFEQARVLILPVSWDGTASYRPGTRFGPEAILNASKQVETWDEELGLSVEPLHYCVLPEVAPLGAGADAMVERIHGAAAGILDRAGDRFLLVLGGEHSLSAGVVRAFAERRPGLSVLHVDAHADLREEYEGTRNSHACACRRIREHVENTVSVGVRSLSGAEAARIGRDKIPVFFARDIAGRTDWVGSAVDRLSDEVYVTIDLDGLDPSIMPAVGTPEPGGLGWYETLALLRETARRRTIVGADIVELSPIPGLAAPDFLAARLAVKLIAYAREGELRAAAAGRSGGPPASEPPAKNA